MKITILGSRAGGFFSGGWYTAQVFEYENTRFLLDCGEGTQMRLYDLGLAQPNFNAIFITHLHGDHVLGLVGLLNSWSMKGRENLLHIFGPVGLQQLLDVHIELGLGYFSFPIDVKELDPTRHDCIFENPHIEVWTLPLLHRVPCCGFLFREKARQKKIRAEKIAEFSLNYEQIRAIKAGADLVLASGETIPNDALTLPPAPLLSYAYCTDTAYNEPLVEYIQGVTCLFHEATFTEEFVENAASSMHSTASDAAKIARLAGVNKLLMGHISSRFDTFEPLEAEAQAIFPNSTAAQPGETYEIAHFLAT